MTHKTDYNASKSQNNFKNSSSYERLKTVVNSLNQTVNSSLINFNSNVDLNPEKVKLALEELIGGKDGIVYVVLDDSGNLFSKNLLEEANASLNCLKKMKMIIQGDDRKLDKPIILVTGKNQAIKIVFILPSEFQSIGNARNYPLVYSIDPLNGKRDLLNQANNKILEMYLKKGSIDNRINPLFVNGIETSEYKNDVKKCKDDKECGWWCIYYCLFLLYDGNDHFIDHANWSTISIEKIKTVLLAHVDILASDEQNIEKKILKEKSIKFIKKLIDIDEEIKKFFRVKESKIQENLDLIKNSSIDEKIKNIQNAEEIINREKEKLKKEIQELDDIIKQGEVLVSSNKNTFETTDSQFKRIVTGDEKASLEANALKKEEKSKESILAYNENERKDIIEKEIQKLGTSLSEEEDRLKENINKKNELLLYKQNNNLQIITNEKNIDIYKNQITEQNSNLISYENQKKNLDTFKSEINRILIDSQYKDLFEKLSKYNIDCDKNAISSIITTLEACDKKLKDYTANLVWYDNEINRNNDQIAEKKILITSCNSSISDLKTKLSNTNSQISHYAQKVEEYSGWFNSWWWKNDLESFNKSLNNWKSTKTQQNNIIANYKREISNHETTIKELESTNNDHKTNKLIYQEYLETERNNRLKYIDNLKKKRDLAINKITEKIKNLDQNIKEFQKAVGISDVDIKSAEGNIKKLKEEIERQNKELNKIELSLTLNDKSKKDIVDKINKAKEKLKVINFFFKVGYYFEYITF
jgi:predicted  nucleic acid-binding Zn-ribbon protein